MKTNRELERWLGFIARVIIREGVRYAMRHPVLRWVLLAFAGGVVAWQSANPDSLRERIHQWSAPAQAQSAQVR